MSASMVAPLKRVSAVAFSPNATTATRSARAFPATNARAAASACSIDAPRIERERSIAITTLFRRPRFSASSPTTLWPFSRRLRRRLRRRRHRHRDLRVRLRVDVPDLDRAGPGGGGDERERDEGDQEAGASHCTIPP